MPETLPADEARRMRIVSIGMLMGVLMFLGVALARAPDHQAAARCPRVLVRGGVRAALSPDRRRPWTARARIATTRRPGSSLARVLAPPRRLRQRWRRPASSARRALMMGASLLPLAAAAVPRRGHAAEVSPRFRGLLSRGRARGRRLRGAERPLVAAPRAGHACGQGAADAGGPRGLLTAIQVAAHRRPRLPGRGPAAPALAGRAPRDPPLARDPPRPHRLRRGRRGRRCRPSWSSARPCSIATSTSPTTTPGLRAPVALTADGRPTSHLPDRARAASGRRRSCSPISGTTLAAALGADVPADGFAVAYRSGGHRGHIRVRRGRARCSSKRSCAGAWARRPRSWPCSRSGWPRRCTST